MSQQITSKMDKATSNGAKKLFTAFSLILMFFAANLVSANEWTFADDFESYALGNLNEQGGWAVTKYDGNTDDTVNVSKTNPDEGTKYIEITNSDSIIVTHDITPINTGIFQFRMRHNKLGLFYFYALTSDAGGQLLFSIQFTESNGILLEEANKQITLRPDYNADQWYLFTIDFDNTRGTRGTFKIKIDDGNYSEYEYVDSESTIFDLAQIKFGSENSGGTAMSAFGDIKSTLIATTTLPTTETTSTSLNVTTSSVSMPTSMLLVPVPTSSLVSAAEASDQSLLGAALDTLGNFFGL